MKTLGELKARLKKQHAKILLDYYECLPAQQKKEVDKVEAAYEPTEYDGPQQAAEETKEEQVEVKQKKQKFMVFQDDASDEEEEAGPQARQIKKVNKVTVCLDSEDEEVSDYQDSGDEERKIEEKTEIIVEEEPEEVPEEPKGPVCDCGLTFELEGRPDSPEWQPEDISAEAIDLAVKECEAVFGAETTKALYQTKTIVKHMRFIKQLERHLAVLPDEVITTADLFFKWLSIAIIQKPSLARDKEAFEFVMLLIQKLIESEKKM